MTGRNPHNWNKPIPKKKTATYIYKPGREVNLNNTEMKPKYQRRFPAHMDDYDACVVASKAMLIDLMKEGVKE